MIKCVKIANNIHTFMQEHSLINRPETLRVRTTIFFRTMRQFALLATFSVMLFLGAAAIAARPLPAYLASVFFILGFLVFILGIALAYFLARSLTQPIIGLSRQMSRLGPDRWTFHRSVHTGDEVELLDRMAKDMAARLEQGYRGLESEIERRTKELKEQYVKDRTILTSIHHGIIVTDARGNIVDINPAALGMMGRREAHVLGQSVSEVLPLSHHQVLMPKEQHPVLRCLKRKSVIRPLPDEQLSIVQPNHNHVPIMLVASPLSMGRHFLGVIAVFHDVTEERQLDYMKSEFISLASHQLRTPLSAITWYLELLTTDEQEKLSTTQKSYVSEMMYAGKRMSQLIDALLHASRLEGGGIKPTFRSVNAVTLVREASETARSLAKDRGVSLEIKAPAKALTLLTDPTLVQIVVHNILSNAVKYSAENSTVTIAIARDGARVNISVKDTGVGIPQSEQKRVFSRLFRASNVRKVDTTGSGLGLYISRMIMNQLGGKILFRSNEKSGSTFIVQLPLHPRKKRGQKA